MLRQLAQVICASSVSRHPLAILRARTYCTFQSIIRATEHNLKKWLRVSEWHFPAQHRTLYSFSSMGIDAYLQKCEQTKSYFGERQNQFKGRMRACVDATPSRDTMIFTQDIKNMMHLCERHPKDIDLLLKMLRRFCAQDSGSFTENYHFGPVLMRMLNYYDLDDVAMTVGATQCAHINSINENPIAYLPKIYCSRCSTTLSLVHFSLRIQRCKYYWICCSKGTGTTMCSVYMMPWLCDYVKKENPYGNI